MAKVRDFGQDPAPGSGVFRVTAVEDGRLLGKVRAKDMDEALEKAPKKIRAARTVDFVITEIPLGEK